MPLPPKLTQSWSVNTDLQKGTPVKPYMFKNINHSRQRGYIELYSINLQGLHIKTTVLFMLVCKEPLHCSLQQAGCQIDEPTQPSAGVQHFWLMSANLWKGVRIGETGWKWMKNTIINSLALAFWKGQRNIKKEDHHTFCKTKPRGAKRVWQTRRVHVIPLEHCDQFGKRNTQIWITQFGSQGNARYSSRRPLNLLVCGMLPIAFKVYVYSHVK